MTTYAVVEHVSGSVWAPNTPFKNFAIYYDLLTALRTGIGKISTTDPAKFRQDFDNERAKGSLVTNSLPLTLRTVETIVCENDSTFSAKLMRVPLDKSL